MRVALALAVLAACAAAATARAAGPLQTAVAEHFEFDSGAADAPLSLQRIRAAGATVFRADLEWFRVAPAKRPAPSPSQ